jgi:hypothetical protein
MHRHERRLARLFCGIRAGPNGPGLSHGPETRRDRVRRAYGSPRGRPAQTLEDEVAVPTGHDNDGGLGSARVSHSSPRRLPPAHVSPAGGGNPSTRVSLQEECSGRTRQLLVPLGSLFEVDLNLRSPVPGGDRHGSPRHPCVPTHRDPDGNALRDPPAIKLDRSGPPGRWCGRGSGSRGRRRRYGGCRRRSAPSRVRAAPSRGDPKDDQDEPSSQQCGDQPRREPAGPSE